MDGWLKCQAFVMALLIAVFAASIRALAQPSALFTEDQVAQGRLDYSQHCATCHGAQLQNGGAPPLIGEFFKDRWNSRPVGGFYDYVHQTMPLGDAASLAPGVYVDIVAFILAQNGFPTGAKPLSKAEREAPLDFRPRAPARPPFRRRRQRS